MIPAEAVEAAAKALRERELGRPLTIADVEYVHNMQDARAALEAAAPYMQAALVADGWCKRCAKDCACACHANRLGLPEHPDGYCP